MSITAHPSSKLISSLQTPSCHRAGQISPPIPLSWLHSPSSAFSHTPLPLQDPNTPSSLPLLFIQSFQGHIPPILTLYQGERASKGIPQIFVLCPPCLPPYIFLRPILWLSFLFLSSPYSHHVRRSCVPSGVSSLRRDQHHLTLEAHPSHGCMDRTDLSTLSPCMCLSMFPCSFIIHFAFAFFQYIWISWPHAGLNMSHD